MVKMQSLDIETDGKPRNPYGHSGYSGLSPVNATRTYFMFCLALFVIFGVGKMMLPTDNSDDEWTSKGDAAGGWGTEHNHPVQNKVASASIGASGSGSKPSLAGNANSWISPVSSPSSYTYNQNSEAVDLEIRESDLLMVITPIVIIPSHARPEYEKYQTEEIGDVFDSSQEEEVLYDKNTPHGMAFDFMLNRDKRPMHNDDAHLIQRFVLTLLFYATGGRDETSEGSSSSQAGGRTSGWESVMAHFLTGMHECHWVKKSLEDQFWGILSLDSDTDRRVGVTKCNPDMEVTEIRLGWTNPNVIGRA
ncbi:hypothetical protein ACHAWF_005300 [Thalassiosira exigua]